MQNSDRTLVTWIIKAIDTVTSLLHLQKHKELLYPDHFEAFVSFKLTAVLECQSHWVLSCSGLKILISFKCTESWYLLWTS